MKMRLCRRLPDWIQALKELRDCRSDLVVPLGSFFINVPTARAQKELLKRVRTAFELPNDELAEAVGVPIGTLLAS
jgi:hypothetical protein